jgi:hypothetical protein
VSESLEFVKHCHTQYISSAHVGRYFLFTEQLVAGIIVNVIRDLPANRLYIDSERVGGGPVAALIV